MKRLLERFFWATFGQPLMSLVPTPLWSIRVMILRVFGCQVGMGVFIYPSVKVYLPRFLTIGDGAVLGRNVYLLNPANICLAGGVVISERTTICSASRNLLSKDLPLSHKPVKIGENTWVGMDSYIGPGVTIGDGVIITARTNIFKNIPANSIVKVNLDLCIKPRNTE